MNGLPPMLKATLTVSAVVLIILGSGLMFATHLMAAWYGTAESPAGNNAIRTAGAAILALGVLAWIGKKQDMAVIRALIIPILFIWFSLKSIVAYLALMDSVFRAPAGRAGFVCDVVLALIYGYYFFVSRSGVARAGSR